MIVKIQRPLSDPAAPALAYNQDRSFETMVEFSELLRETMGARLKIYCEAVLEGDELVVYREVKSESW